MFIADAKKLAVGAIVEDLDVVISTAGKTTKVDGKWEQKLGLTDTSGHIWAVLKMTKNNPCCRTNALVVRSATIDEFTTKGGGQDKKLIIDKYEQPTYVGEPPEEGSKFEGVLDPLVENILERYSIAVTDALWPLKRKNKSGVVSTQWIIYHRYCEQIAAKAGIIFDKPEVAVNDRENHEVVLLVTGRMGHTVEWSYGEASAKTTILPYIWAMAEKRGKDRVILKLAGFHGMVYSDAEENWKNNKE